MSHQPFYRLILILTLLACIGTAGAQVKLDAWLLNKDIKVLFLSDFNFTGNAAMSGDFFQLQLTNQTPSDQSIRVRLEVGWDGGEDGKIAEGITRPFLLQMGEIRMIRSSDLLGGHHTYSLEDYAIDSDAELLKDKILKTGKVPSGVYSFRFQIMSESMDSVLDERQIDILITNPTTLYLQSPGASAELELQSIFSPYPLFRWISDMNRFRLIVAEKLDDVHDQAAPDEIIQDRVIFEKELIVDPTLSQVENGVETVVAPAYTYPSVGAPALQAGKTYYWQVHGLVNSAGQQIELPSEIWAFRVADLTQASTSRVLATLLSSLQCGNLESFFGPGSPLEGYEPTGIFMINGQPISLQAVQQILAKIQSGEYQLVDTTCE
ncbi:hypothetical protein JW992_02235 [candidate division KSB1 bacterium]|nr:hypothetical protein [candidate division KSB1 bacterium]